MSETNPYAPPAITESEASPALYWQTDGAGVLARNGAMLPKVDLETGVSEPEMKGVARTYQSVGISSLIGSVVIIGVVLMIALDTLSSHEWVIWGVIGGAVILEWLVRLRVKPRGTIMVWEFRESARERRRLLRRRWRMAMLLLSFLLMIVGPVIVGDIASFGSAWTLRLVACGMGLVTANGIWTWLDRGKTRNQSGPPGWLRIHGIHPLALAELTRLEALERAKIATDPAPRKRRGFTSYYHRYPIAALLGGKRVNPLTLLLIVLMKLLGSKRLERESFDFTEAREIREDEAHEKLRESIHAWHAIHPDWQVLVIERLPTPAGDLMTETAILASPGFEHCLCLNHSWLEQRSASGTGGFSIHTWLKDGKMICTTPMPLLPIDRPNADIVRVKGTAEAVFQVHLARCSSREIDAAGTREEILDRFRREKEELRELLERAGLQGPVREIG